MHLNHEPVVSRNTTPYMERIYIKKILYRYPPNIFRTCFIHMRLGIRRFSHFHNNQKELKRTQSKLSKYFEIVPRIYCRKKKTTQKREKIASYCKSIFNINDINFRQPAFSFTYSFEIGLTKEHLLAIQRKLFI